MGKHTIILAPVSRELFLVQPYTDTFAFATLTMKLPPTGNLDPVTIPFCAVFANHHWHILVFLPPPVAAALHPNAIVVAFEEAFHAKRPFPGILNFSATLATLMHSCEM